MPQMEKSFAACIAYRGHVPIKHFKLSKKTQYFKTDKRFQQLLYQVYGWQRT